jgi:hypothetical protein
MGIKHLKASAVAVAAIAVIKGATAQQNNIVNINYYLDQGCSEYKNQFSDATADGRCYGWPTVGDGSFNIGTVTQRGQVGTISCAWFLDVGCTQGAPVGVADVTIYNWDVYTPGNCANTAHTIYEPKSFSCGTY